MAPSLLYCGRAFNQATKPLATCVRVGAGLGVQTKRSAAGVAVGAITGDWAWAAAGAAIGAGAGYLTEQERQRQTAAQQRAFNEGVQAGKQQAGTKN